MTRKAIVFDNSGTLIERYRVIKDVSTGELITHINSLDLIDSCLNAALVVLQFNTNRLKDLDPNTLISDYIIENNKEGEYAGDIEYSAICKLYNMYISILINGYDGYNIFNIYDNNEEKN